MTWEQLHAPGAAPGAAQCAKQGLPAASIGAAVKKQCRPAQQHEEHGKPSASACVPNPTLDTMPEELILRIIYAMGGPRDQMRQAFVLGATCSRLRAVLIGAFLPSLNELNKRSLEALSLSDPPSARVALSEMLQRAKALRNVYLSGFSPEVFTRDCYQILADVAGNQLRIVNLAYSYIKDDDVRPLLHCPQLEDLSLYGCANISGRCFSEPGLSAPLHSLDLSFMHGLVPGSISFISSLKNTKHLKVMGCTVINAVGIFALIAGPIVKSLTSIALNFCPIDDHSLMTFIEATPKLTSLKLAKHTENLWDTGAYTAETVELLSLRYPNLSIVVEN